MYAYEFICSGEMMPPPIPPKAGSGTGLCAVFPPAVGGKKMPLRSLAD